MDDSDFAACLTFAFHYESTTFERTVASHVIYLQSIWKQLKRKLALSVYGNYCYSRVDCGRAAAADFMEQNHSKGFLEKTKKKKNWIQQLPNRAIKGEVLLL
jgi:hypothetical protein